MTLHAGAAARDITPKKPLFLVGYPNVERTSTGVHDPLLASALCLRGDAATVILVAVDILQVDPALARELRRAVADDAGIPEAHVFIGCTHTHSGPVTCRTRPEPADPEYLKEFKAGVVDAAASAAGSVRPAELAWTTADARGVGGNRHSKDGASDPEVGVLVVRDVRTHTPIALSMTYAMHPTVLHEDSTLVSSDFPHYARLHLTEALGEDMVVLYHTGPAGNQSPRYHVTGQTFAEAERLGRMLGARVLDGIERTDDAACASEVLLGGGLASVELPPRALPTLAEAEAQLSECIAAFERLKSEGASHGPVRTAECAVFGAEHTVDFVRRKKTGELDRLVDTYTPTDVQAVRVGDACLVGLPGELFVEYGLDVKRRAPRRTFVVSLVNGDLRGYIVTPEAAEAGCYEASTGIFDAASGGILVDAAINLLGGLCNDPRD